MPRSLLAGSAALTCALLAGSAAPVRADAAACHVIDVDFTPAADLQMAVWLEDASGHFVDTLFVTQLTGTYGLGNRPGILQFNSSKRWPYGRREHALPVWAHHQGKTFPRVIFQNNDDTNLSHPFDQSSAEIFYSRPLLPDETSSASSHYTDKGTLSPTLTSVYPPRADVEYHAGLDSAAVQTYKDLNPFDAVSQATPPGGARYELTWPIPPNLTSGDYVVWVEVSKEADFNGTYNQTTYPSPTKPDGSPLPWHEYGVPARGQPSVVYKVPITFSASEVIATTSSYAGYGDPEGADGNVRGPDVTITSDTPGSGAARLQLTVDGSDMYRVKVAARPEFDDIAPGAIADSRIDDLAASTATVAFNEPGDDGLIGPVKGYEVRYVATTEMTEATFADGMPVSTTIMPIAPGMAQQITLNGLLPETNYWVGVRAYDECRNYGPLAIVPFTTLARQSGYVDACFVATAAYGSFLANDVEMLRRFRDQYLQSHVLGELLVETYYSVGPAVAGVVEHSDPLRAMARDVLEPAVDWVRHLAR
ncbi:MAG: fibronectin type III domain-containing protein [Deltaproteobacteria bacterium]|nr:fibronectin type III domain-containing protein [Deltaproteobacteria bacterium]